MEQPGAHQALDSLKLVPFRDVLENVCQEAHAGLQALADRLPPLEDQQRCVCEQAVAPVHFGDRVPAVIAAQRPYSTRLRPPAAAAAAAAADPAAADLLWPPPPACPPAARPSYCSTCRPRGSACSACMCVRSGHTRPRRSTHAGRC